MSTCEIQTLIAYLPVDAESDPACLLGYKKGVRHE